MWQCLTKFAFKTSLLFQDCKQVMFILKTLSNLCLYIRLNASFVHTHTLKQVNVCNTTDLLWVWLVGPVTRSSTRSERGTRSYCLLPELFCVVCVGTRTFLCWESVWRHWSESETNVCFRFSWAYQYVWVSAFINSALFKHVNLYKT